MEENNKLDNIEFETNSQATAYWKLLSLIAIENKNRIDELEKELILRKKRYVFFNLIATVSVIVVLLTQIISLFYG